MAEIAALARGDGAVIITGGTSGIGLGIAKALAALGRPVMIFGRSAELCEDAAAVLAGYASDPSAFAAIPADTTDEGQLAGIVAEALRRWGSVDGLVTAAGCLARGGLFDLGAEDFRAALETNVIGTWRAIRAVAPAMATREFGRIVTIGSVLGAVGVADRAGYAATKGAVAALTRSLALELAPNGITINCVAPGPVRTPMNESDTQSPASEAFLRMLPVGRWGTPQDIAHVAIPLLAKEASYMTGSTVYVDGGYTSH